MRVVIAPDSFKESLSAAQAAAAMRRGVLAAWPDAECVLIPLSDGGEGFLDAFGCDEIRTGFAHDALGRPIQARYGRRTDGTAVVESATAIGLGLIAPTEREAGRAGSHGLGELILAALDTRPRRIVIGLGGTATTDGGAGMLTALGARLIDVAGQAIPTGGLGLARLEKVDLAGLDPRLREVEIVGATDVRNPLVGPDGAARVFAPQKGADPDMVLRLEAGLNNFAALTGAAGSPAVSPDTAGAGAAGGVGYALLLLGARLESGFDLVADATGLGEALRGADLCLTGEGRVDSQTALGKAPGRVAALAAEHHVPTYAFCGSTDGQAGFARVVPITPAGMPLHEAMRRAPALLEAAVTATLKAGLGGQAPLAPAPPPGQPPANLNS